MQSVKGPHPHYAHWSSVVQLLHLSRLWESSLTKLTKLSLFMSSFTHSFNVFLLLHLPFVPSTCNSLHADTQSLLCLRYTWPYHLSRPRLATSSTLTTLKQFINSVVHFLSLNVTPHIQFRIIWLIKRSTFWQIARFCQRWKLSINGYLFVNFNVSSVSTLFNILY